MLAAAITFALSPFQLVCCIVVLFATVALTWVLGLGEGRARAVIELEELLEREEQQQLTQKGGAVGGRHV